MLFYVYVCVYVCVLYVWYKTLLFPYHNKYKFHPGQQIPRQCGMKQMDGMSNNVDEVFECEIIDRMAHSLMHVVSIFYYLFTDTYNLKTIYHPNVIY